MMKFVILVCVFVTINALSEKLIDEARAKIQEFGIACAEQEKASDEDLAAIMEGTMPVTHGGKCTIFCTLNKLNVIKDDGSFGPGMTEWMGRVQKDDPDVYGKFVKLQDACISKVKVEDDPCETAVQMTICGKEESQKLGIDKVLF